MTKMKFLAMGPGLDIERALTPAERRRILDAPGMLSVLGGR